MRNFWPCACIVSLVLNFYLLGRVDSYGDSNKRQSKTIDNLYNKLNQYGTEQWEAFVRCKYYDYSPRNPESLYDSNRQP